MLLFPFQGMVVATIAKFDWPDEWPDLFPQLLAGLSPNSTGHTTAATHGSLRCLSLMAEHMSSSALPRVAALLFPELQRIYDSPVSAAVSG